MSKLHVAAFRSDVTVPLGHSLCGGWIKPAEVVTEPLYALGIVLLGEEAPVVLCAVDWTGICNDAHRFWRDRLAAAAHTTPERVSVHCVHQHNAPFADLTAQKLVAEQAGLNSIVDVRWFEQTVERTAATVRAALAETRPVSHLAFGKAKVERVASNRRLMGPDGKLRGWRGSSCQDAKLRAEPEGLIDPWLRTISFWNGEQKLATLHFYATHPMSYYGDGQVTSDFVGLAREARSHEEGVLHIYFTGCAGDIAAGKYNDGDKSNRFLLAQRLYAAMVDSEKQVERVLVTKCAWQSRSVILPPRSDAAEAALLATLADGSKTTAVRNRAAMKLSYRRRAAAKSPIILGSLRFGDVLQTLHLPAECFVEFQLYAQNMRPGGFFATAAYGDGGPWYIPPAKAFAEGGYEPSAAFADPEAEELLKDGIRALLKA